MSYPNELLADLRKRGPATRTQLQTRTNAGPNTVRKALERLRADGAVLVDDGKLYYAADGPAPAEPEDPVLAELRRLGPRRPQQLINSPRCLTTAQHLAKLELDGLIRWTPDGRHLELAPSREARSN